MARRFSNCLDCNVEIFTDRPGPLPKRCDTCKVEAGRQNHSAWMAANRETALQRNRDYKAARRKQVTAVQRDYYARNRDAILGQKQDYYGTVTRRLHEVPERVRDRQNLQARS